MVNNSINPIKKRIKEAQKAVSFYYLKDRMSNSFIDMCLLLNIKFVDKFNF